MIEARECPGCGTKLKPDAGEGFCPVCDLRAALESGDREANALDGESGATSGPAARTAIGVERFGDFELEEEIARGGMGVVYRARQLSLNRLVAVKMILAGRLATEAEIGRFQAEARAAAKLRHPNIVAIHGIDVHEGQHFFSMELVQGQDLAKLVRGNPLSAEEASRYVKAIAGAIDYAHHNGIVHRDLKPSNVLIDENGQPRITDFGLAKELKGDSDYTLSGQVVGSPNFMPPEQAEGRKNEVGPHSDIYSLGAILFFLVTGRPPFVADSLKATLHQVVEREPISPRALNPSLPRDLETICLKCLEKNPARRYGSAQELSDELGRFLKGEPIRARPVTKPVKVWRWCGRNRALASSIAATVLLLAILAIGSTVAALRISAAAAEGRQRESRLRVGEGWQRAEAGDLSGSLVPFTEALLLDKDDPARVQMHQERLGALLACCAQLTHVWFPGGPVTHIELSPDGKRVLASTGLLDGSTNRAIAQIWDLETGESLPHPMTHGGTINFAAFSPDGKLVVTASDDHTAQVWDSTTGLPVVPPQRHTGPITYAAFSPDSQLLAVCTPAWSVGTNSEVTVSRTQGGTETLTHEQFGEDVRFLLFMPGGKTILFGSESYLANIFRATTDDGVGSIPDCWGLENAYFNKEQNLLLAVGSFGMYRQAGACVFDITNPDKPKRVSAMLPHSEGVVLDAAFSPDGRGIATAGSDGQIRLWDRTTGALLLAPIHQKGAVVSVVFSPDGSKLLTASRDGTACVWNVASGRLALPPLRHGGPLCGALFTPDGHSVVTGSTDGTVRVWRVQPRSLLHFLTILESPVMTARFSPDGSRFVTGCLDGNVKVWDSTSQKELNELPIRPGIVSDAEFSSDGRQVLVLSYKRELYQQYFLWNSQTGQGRNLKAGGIEFRAIGQRIATLGNEGIQFLNQKGDLPLNIFLPNGFVFDGHIGVIRWGRWNKDGEYLAVLSSLGNVSPDGSVTVWNASAPDAAKPLVRYPSMPSAAAFSPDSRWLAVASDQGDLRLIAVAGQVPPVFQGRHQARVHYISFSPDGQYLLTTAEDGTARTWEVASGRSLALLRQSSVIRATSFSKDGKRWASACSDGIARVWDVQTGEAVTPPLLHAGPVNSVDFSPDGRTLLTSSEDGTARLWNLPPEKYSVEKIAALALLLGGTQPPSAPGISLGSAWEAQTTGGESPEDGLKAVASPSSVRSTDTPLSSAKDAGNLALLLGDAATAEASRNWAQAVNILTRLIETGKTNWEWHFRRGWAELRLGNDSWAAADFTEAIRLNSRASICHIGRYIVDAKKGDKQRAEEELQDILELTPGFRLPYDAQSAAEPPDPSSLDQWSRLLDYCADASEIKSLPPWLCCARGVAEGVYGQWFLAREDFKRSLGGTEHDAATELGLTFSFWGTGTYHLEDTVQAASLTAELAPQNPRAFAARADALLKLGKYEDAARDLRRVIALGHDFFGVRETLGDIEVRLANWPSAISNYQRSIGLAPENASALNKLSWLLANGPPSLRGLSQAGALAERAVSLWPLEADYVRTAGLVCYRSGDYSRAAARLETARFLDSPNSKSPTLFLLAMSQRQAGRTAEAAATYSQAVVAWNKDRAALGTMEDFSHEAAEVFGK